MAIDLISSAVGGRVVSCSDEFFAEASKILQPSEPIWKEHEYTDRGKWMDGWESRRRREPGHDWCVVALGIPGRIDELIVDTSHFTGNYPEQFSLEGCGVGSDDLLGEAEWTEIIAQTSLEGDSRARFDPVLPNRFTHLRLNIFPDGGVARLRVNGRPIPQMSRVCAEGGVDLASLVVGGEVTDASDSYFSPPANMIRPTDPAGMWDGWETKRRRGPGHDWAMFRLGLQGVVDRVLVDTRFFRGNAPGWISLHASDDGETWDEVVTRRAVEPDTVNSIALDSPVSASHLKLDIIPDGGVARFRAFGTASPTSAGAARIEYLNALLSQQSDSFFATVCAASRWVEEMAEGRPFASVEEVLTRSEEVFSEFAGDDWLQAFGGHPRIGERTHDPIAAAEQAGTDQADQGTLDELRRVNLEYEDRFGFTYIVYASGKGADEMLEIAKERLGNNRDQEIECAASEQRKITATRLRKMLCQEVES